MANQDRIIAVFEVPGMNAGQYDNIIERLEAAGEGEPDGRLFHVTGPRGDGWLVVDVWESREKFERFGQTLMPIAHELGLNPQPQLYPVHSLIDG